MKATNNVDLIHTFSMPRDHVDHIKKPLVTKICALNGDHIAGPFSLANNFSVVIDVVPGMIIHVRQGGLAILEEGGNVKNLVQSGMKYLFKKYGQMILKPFSHVELEFERLC